MRFGAPARLVLRIFRFVILRIRRVVAALLLLGVLLPVNDLPAGAGWRGGRSHSPFCSHSLYAPGGESSDTSSEAAEQERDRRCAGCRPLAEFMGARAPQPAAAAAGGGSKRHVLYGNENFYFLFR